MANIRPNPRKTKPPGLPEPCKSCDMYEETEAELHPTRKALLGSTEFRQHFRRCKYDPRLCDPDLAGVCPFADKVGKPLIAITCDVCGKIIKCLSPTSDELDERIASKGDDGVTVFDICDECIRRGREPSS